MSNYLCLYTPGMCGSWLTWLINQHKNFPQYDLTSKDYTNDIGETKTLDVGCFGADWHTYKYIQKKSSYYDENTVTEYIADGHILDYTFKENRENNYENNNLSATKDCIKILPNHNSASDYCPPLVDGLVDEKWHISPSEKFSHSVNKELLKNITEDMQPEKIIVPVFNYQGEDTLIKRWLMYRKTHNLGEDASIKWCYFNNVHQNCELEFWKNFWTEYSNWVQQDNPYGNNVHYVDIGRLLNPSVDEYLKLCETINEKPLMKIQDEIKSYKNIILDVVADFNRGVIK